MTIEERLEKLECELAVSKRQLACEVARRHRQRRYLWIGASLGVMALLSVVLLMQLGRPVAAQAKDATTAPASRPVEKEICANAFILKDTNGRTRARLEMDQRSGNPELRFYDTDGVCRIDLGTYSEGEGKIGSDLRFYDPNGINQAQLCANSGGASLNLCGEGRSRLSQFSNDNGTSMISMWNTNGEVLFQLTADKTIGAILRGFDAKGKCRFEQTTWGPGGGLDFVCLTPMVKKSFGRLPSLWGIKGIIIGTVTLIIGTNNRDSHLSWNNRDGGFTFEVQQGADGTLRPSFGS